MSVHTYEENYTITRAGVDAVTQRAGQRNKQVVFKNSAPFTGENAKDLDVVTRMYNLIEYSDNYAKTSGSLWQYHKDEPNDDITNFESFKFKARITGRTPAAGNAKSVEIVVPLKYLSNFWRTIEMPSINCEINLILN